MIQLQVLLLLSFCSWNQKILEKIFSYTLTARVVQFQQDGEFMIPCIILNVMYQSICVGMAASMGAFLLAGGAKGKRFALPNAEIMIHQPSGGAKGQATEIEIVANMILKTKKKLNETLAANTGQPYEVVARDTERDYYMSAEEAKAYGLIDSIIEYKK